LKNKLKTACETSSKTREKWMAGAVRPDKKTCSDIAVRYVAGLGWLNDSSASPATRWGSDGWTIFGHEMRPAAISGMTFEAAFAMPEM
jgi:hypothetical protein